MYKALVRSHLDYCDTIYHIPASNSQINLCVTLNSSMEKVKRTQCTNRSNIYEELGWETLSDRRWCRRNLHVHKIEKYKTPSYLRDKLPPHRRPLYRFNNSNTFQEIRCKTSRCKNNFFPDATSSWNNMISNFQEIPTFAGLKSHLLSLIRPKIKSTFGIHDALGLRYLFQLRVNLSPLRSHKRRHNFSDTPFETCECNRGFEDNRHFLFERPFYVIQRATLAVYVIDIFQRKNLNHLGNHRGLYLYGHPSLDLIDNRQILLSTIKYGEDTKQFSTAVTQDPQPVATGFDLLCLLF